MSSDLSTSVATFNAIARMCPNLERVNLFVRSDEIANVRLGALEKLRGLHLLQPVLSGKEESSFSCNVLLGGDISRTLEELTGLRCGFVRSARHEDVIREFFIQHPNLKRFEMSDGYMSCPLFRMIADSCPRMRHIAVNDCPHISLDGIERFSNLLSLNISNYVGYNPVNRCQLSDEQIIVICSRNSRLRSLRIVQRDLLLGRTSPKAIATLINIEELEFSADIEEICTLTVMQAAFTDEGLQMIVACVGASLQRFSLFSARYLSDSFIDAIATCCPNLRVLTVPSSMTCRISKTALRRLINVISSSRNNFSPTDDEPFELYIKCATKEWAEEEAANWRTLPNNVVVHCFSSTAVTYHTSSITPVLLSSSNLY